jgi:hypothetical protein
MAQVGPLRECQVVVGSASTLLSPYWSPSGGSFREPVLPICISECLRSLSIFHYWRDYPDHWDAYPDHWDFYPDH